MVKVRKKEYRLAEKIGFIPSNHVVRSVKGNNYYLTDSDYLKMLRTLQNKFIHQK